MKKTISFREGEVYFSVGFVDPEFKLPRIDTYVYCGLEDDEYLFIEATGHVTGKNDEMADSAHYLSMPRDSKSAMLDKKSLLEWLAVEHTPTKPAAIEYEYTDTNQSAKCARFAGGTLRRVAACAPCLSRYVGGLDHGLLLQERS